MEVTAHSISIVGVLDDMSAVEPVLRDLAGLGITSSDVSLMSRDGKLIPASEQTAASPVAGGAATGAAFGGLLGGLAGWMISIGAIAIPGVVVPGVGSVFGAGVLAATLTGIAVGAAAGGLVGALLGLGVPENEAREYESYLKQGRVLLTVHLAPGSNSEPVVGVLEQHGAYDVRTYEVPGDDDEAHTTPVVQPAAAAAPQQVGEQEPEVEQALPRDAIEPTGEYVVGDASAHTEALGSGAAGGYGDGEATGPEPAPAPDEPKPREQA